MAFIAVIAIAAIVALIFGPQYWVKATMAKHGGARNDFPGTGGELARHLLDEAGLEIVKLERTAEGDHYAPADKTVRLSDANFDGRSVTAAAVAAHEVSHAMQDAQGYAPLHLRQKLMAWCKPIERTGSLMLMATPFVFALTRSPVVLLAEVVLAMGILASTVLIHAVTLPTEFDASFKRALPLLTNYLKPEDIPAARSVLRAAAITYVAGALMSLIDFARWIRILRL